MSSPSINSCKITNVTSGECIGLDRKIQVFYSNANNDDGTVSISCNAGTSLPAIAAAPGPAGTLMFSLTHAVPGGTHAINATLFHSGTAVAGDAVRVSVGNPCPIRIGGTSGIVDGLPAVNVSAVLHGTFEPSKGNHVMILVEEKVVVNGRLAQPRLVFASPAEVTVNPGPPPSGEWTYGVVPGAQAGQHIRAVLTKDGKVVSIVRGIFK